MKLQLNSIDEEAAACRKAFKEFPVGGYVLHCHHDSVGEMLKEPAENRIYCILHDKPEHERALRLRLFRPVTGKRLKKWQEAYAKWQEADAKWQEAYAKWQEACAKWQEADAKWQEAYAKWQEADAKWQEAYAKWQEACAKLGPLIHKEFCVKNCPWNGHTIFPTT